jgi:hypothetical protein
MSPSASSGMTTEIPAEEGGKKSASDVGATSAPL